jgi:hypothetical protein
VQAVQHLISAVLMSKVADRMVVGSIVSESEPSQGELGRLMRSLGQTMQQQFGDINKRLDSFVPAQLHALYERRVDENLDRLKDDIADVKKDIEKDIADLVKLTNKNRTDSKQEIKDLKDGQRWWWTAVIVPGLLALIAIVGLVINIIRGG